MKDLTSLKTDFRDWLTLPMTKTFIELLIAEQDKLYKGANQYTFKNYHKKELDKIAVTTYGKVDGIRSVIAILETCKEEEPEITIIEGKEVKTYPTINGLFEQAFEPETENKND